MSTLYIIGTPIGNLGDIGPRALEVLGQVDFIAAEDTRVSMKLLNHFGIKKPMISYYQGRSWLPFAMTRGFRFGWFPGPRRRFPRWRLPGCQRGALPLRGFFR